MPDYPPTPASPGALHVDPLMADLRGRVRQELRRELRARMSAPELDDQAIFDAVDEAFRGAVTRARRGALILPELIDDDDWQLQPSLTISSHRTTLGPAILFVKRRLLLPLTRWLYDYARGNFERQQRMNETVFACLQALAADNARLRRDVEALQSGRGSRPAE